nr:hypothetical protein [Tanacetum cinerariifolium]
MPPKPDLVFHTAPIAVETDHSAFTVQLSPFKPAQDLSHTTRPLAPIIEDWVSDSDDESETNDQTDPQSVSSFVQSSESVDHLIKDCNYHAMKKAQPIPRNYAHKGYNKQNASFTHKHPPKHMVPAAVLTQSKLVSITAVIPVSVVVPKIMVTRPRHAHLIIKKSKSPIRRHITRIPSLKASNSPHRVTVAQALVLSVAKGKKGKWYALTVNPTIYVTCIKQFWNTIVGKQSNDVTRLQALVDRKKVVIMEAAIRDALRLDDADGVDCLPNEEIFAELARMGYEKPSTKLTFYKAFFSSQCRKFNFSKYIFKSLVRNIDSSSKFYMYPRRVGKGCSGVKTPLFEGMLVAGEPEEQGDAKEQVHGNDNDAIQRADTTVLGDDVQDQSIPSPTPPQSPPPQPQSPPLAQPHDADFLMSLLHEALDAYDAFTRRVEHLEHDKVAQDLEITKLKTRRIESSADTDMEDASNQGRMIADLDRDKGVALIDDEGTEKKAEDAQVLSMQEDKPELQEAVEVVTTAKLITEVVTAASESITAASTTISAAEP